MWVGSVFSLPKWWSNFFSPSWLLSMGPDHASDRSDGHLRSLLFFSCWVSCVSLCMTAAIALSLWLCLSREFSHVIPYSKGTRRLASLFSHVHLEPHTLNSSSLATSAVAQRLPLSMSSPYFLSSLLTSSNLMIMEAKVIIWCPNVWAFVRCSCGLGV